MLKAVLLAPLVLILLSGAAILWLAPSRTATGLLNGADRLTGGGIGVERAGESIAFGAHGLRLDVWRPSARSRAPRPVVIFFYGGAWRTGSRTVYAFVGRALAQLGYVVVIPDYRKAPKVRFPAFMEDAAQALAWTRRQVSAFGGDAGKIVVAGHSAGAHMAMLLALDERWTAMEALPADTVTAVVGISGPYDFYPFTDGETRAVFDGASPQDHQPIHFARSNAPPILIVASSADPRVKVRNSVVMAARLHDVGADAELVLVPGLSHEMTLLVLMRQLSWKASLRGQVARFLTRATAS